MDYKKEKVCDSGRSNIGYCNHWLGKWLVVLSTYGILVGCTTIKKAAVTATAAAVGATAGTVLSGGVAAPILGATTTAFAADVVTEITSRPSGFSRGKDMTDCAGDNFWTLLGQIIEMGGWFLLLLVVAPMILGWILPGPLERKKKQS
jgi:hypothetical protein